MATRRIGPHGDVPRPPVGWTDHVARRLRTNRAAGAAYTWFAKRLIPLLFAICAGLVGLVLVLPAFIPKFYRNRQRRRRYRPRWVREPIQRIPPAPAERPDSSPTSR